MPRRRAHVDHHRSTRGEPIAHELEELFRDQVKRYVGLAIRVDDDSVEPLLGGLQPRARIGLVHRQVRLAHAEVAIANIGHCRVDLDSVDLPRWPKARVLHRSRAPRIAQHRQAAIAGPINCNGKTRQTIPVSAHKTRGSNLDGVLGPAFVESQNPLALLIVDDLYELVGRFALPDDVITRCRLDSLLGHEQEQTNHQRDKDRFARQEWQRRCCQDQCQDEQRAPRPNPRHQHQDRDKRAKERAHGRQRIEPTRDSASLLNRRDRQADRPRRDRAKCRDWNRKGQ